jgi:hypothetical protein
MAFCTRLACRTSTVPAGACGGSADEEMSRATSERDKSWLAAILEQRAYGQAGLECSLIIITSLKIGGYLSMACRIG